MRGTLIGVYKADGGVAGELSYFFGHLIGTRSCSLCDISHSLVSKKSSFKEERNCAMQWCLYLALFFCVFVVDAAR